MLQTAFHLQGFASNLPHLSTQVQQKSSHRVTLGRIALFACRYLSAVKVRDRSCCCTISTTSSVTRHSLERRTDHILNRQNSKQTLSAISATQNFKKWYSTLTIVVFHLYPRTPKGCQRSHDTLRALKRRSIHYWCQDVIGSR